MNKRILKHTFSLLNIDYVKLDAKWNYTNIISPYHRIYYIDEGGGSISDTNNKFSLEPGFLYIIPSYTLCNLNCADFMSQFFVQFFEESAEGDSLFTQVRVIQKVRANEQDVRNFQRLVEINPGRGINRSDNPKVYEKSMYYKEYQQLNNHQKISDFLETQGILLQLISRFVALQAFQSDERRITPVKILEAVRFINVNLHLPLSVKMMA